MNTYSRRWFETFLGRIDDAIVEREVAFLKRQLGHTRRILDLCCGPGRHAAPLSTTGLDVVGLDLDSVAIRDASARTPNARFVRGDMRRLPLRDQCVDAVICMWQSFGHFDGATNRAVLGEMARVVAENGRVILDLYHRDFHAARVGQRTIVRDGVHVSESRVMRRERLIVRLEYEGSRSEDVFEWQLYTPDELRELGESAGLSLRLACAEFDEAVAASAECARMQLVFQRRPKRQ